MMALQIVAAIVLVVVFNAVSAAPLPPATAPSNSQTPSPTYNPKAHRFIQFPPEKAWVASAPLSANQNTNPRTRLIKKSSSTSLVSSATLKRKAPTPVAPSPNEVLWARGLPPVNVDIAPPPVILAASSESEVKDIIAREYSVEPENSDKEFSEDPKNFDGITVYSDSAPYVADFSWMSSMAQEVDQKTVQRHAKSISVSPAVAPSGLRTATDATEPSSSNALKVSAILGAFVVVVAGFLL